MPSAMKKPCPGEGGRCGVLIAASAKRCDKHAQQTERARGTRTERGYGTDWDATKDLFRRRIAGVPAVMVCGARLPGALATRDSECMANGYLLGEEEHLQRFGTRLHIDHIESFTNLNDPRRLDLFNLQALCFTCHMSKSQREQGMETRCRG